MPKLGVGLREKYRANFRVRVWVRIRAHIMVRIWILGDGENNDFLGLTLGYLVIIIIFSYS